MSQGKINLKFKRVAEETLVHLAAATVGEPLPPTHGDIPQTREELEKEIKRALTFTVGMDQSVTKSTIDDLQSHETRKKLEAKIAEIRSDKRNRGLFGLGDFKKEARKELDDLQKQLDALDSRKKAHQELISNWNNTNAKLINRIGKMEKALVKCSEPVVVQAEAPVVQDAPVKKISLNFKRVTGEQTEAMAEGTLVTGGFDLPEHKASQRRIAAFIEATEKAERRMREEREDAERRRMEAERRQRDEEERERRRQDEARRRAAEEHQRMSREAERYRSREAERFSASGASSRSSGIGHGGSPMSSRW